MRRSARTVNEHLVIILVEKELEEDSVVRNFRIVQMEIEKRKIE